jgi:hypothetical protein
MTVGWKVTIQSGRPLLLRLFGVSSGRHCGRILSRTDRLLAFGMAQKIEAAYRMNFTEAQARKVVSGIDEQSEASLAWS